jgi:thiosulfate dehydrogenase
MVFVFGSGYVAGMGNTTITLSNVQASVMQVIDSSMLFFMVPSGASSGPLTVATTSPAASATSWLNVTPDDGYGGTWVKPAESTIPNNAEGDMIRYGRELMTKTHYYFNVLGVVPGYSTGNDLNCTSCHVGEGTVALSSPFSAVYPKYVAGTQYFPRSGKYLNNEGRIQGCLKRSMNAQTQTLPETGYEMQSMVAYFKWLATGMKVANWTQVKGQGFPSVPLLTRPVDPVRGQVVYETYCASCHGTDGLGSTVAGVVVPPVWGSRSFNDGAGMFRPRTAITFIRANMPLGKAVPTDPTTWLSLEDAWDVTAYVVYQNRPVFFNLANDWPTNHVSPIDGVPDWVRKAPDAWYAPYYPRWDGAHYTYDTAYPQIYNENKHKYGPWQDMLSLQTKMISDFKLCGRSPCP